METEAPLAGGDVEDVEEDKDDDDDAATDEFLPRQWIRVWPSSAAFEVKLCNWLEIN